MNTECAIQKNEGVAEMRLEWDNRRARLDRFQFWFLILFWIVWAPATLFSTFMIFHSDSPIFFSLWCIFGWLGTLGIPHALLQILSTEWVTVSSESLVHGQQGPLARKSKSIPLESVYEVMIGRYDTDQDGESVVTLNVFYWREICTPVEKGLLRLILPIHEITPKKRAARLMIGYWLHPALKERVFRDLQEFAGKHQLPITFQRD